MEDVVLVSSTGIDTSSPNSLSNNSPVHSRLTRTISKFAFEGSVSNITTTTTTTTKTGSFVSSAVELETLDAQHVTITTTVSKELTVNHSPQASKEKKKKRKKSATTKSSETSKKSVVKKTRKPKEKVPATLNERMVAIFEKSALITVPDEYRGNVDPSHHGIDITRNDSNGYYINNNDRSENNDNKDENKNSYYNETNDKSQQDDRMAASISSTIARHDISANNRPFNFGCDIQLNDPDYDNARLLSGKPGKVRALRRNRQNQEKQDRASGQSKRLKPSYQLEAVPKPQIPADFLVSVEEGCQNIKQLKLIFPDTPKPKRHCSSQRNNSAETISPVRNRTSFNREKRGSESLTMFDLASRIPSDILSQEMRMLDSRSEKENIFDEEVPEAGDTDSDESPEIAVSTSSKLAAVSVLTPNRSLVSGSGKSITNSRAEFDDGVQVLTKNVHPRRVLTPLLNSEVRSQSDPFVASRSGDDRTSQNAISLPRSKRQDSNTEKNSFVEIYEISDSENDYGSPLVLSQQRPTNLLCNSPIRQLSAATIITISSSPIHNETGPSKPDKLNSIDTFDEFHSSSPPRASLSISSARRLTLEPDKISDRLANSTDDSYSFNSVDEVPQSPGYADSENLLEYAPYIMTVGEPYKDIISGSPPNRCSQPISIPSSSISTFSSFGSQDDTANSNVPITDIHSEPQTTDFVDPTPLTDKTADELPPRTENVDYKSIYEAMPLDELRRTVDKYGFKPRRSRQAMIELLLSCHTDTTDIPSIAAVSQPSTSMPNSDSDMRSKLFTRISTQIRTNPLAKPWWTKMLLYEPLPLESFQRFLQQTLSIDLDLELVRSWCDHCGVCTRASDPTHSDTPSSQTSETEV
ncbi:structure-specific endonuclease subunit [Sugiyamaella lignohabitans]|uniref:Structure-specific endonuclease subunit SLX4 n=1 Tax=Sugiyamaella lignohabitans TaxID=796027 RepID=A0A161HKX8_9ASCO|nr:structure-specific endonuclease subunit [Sugiyamaella lignohabitans]ANB13817.1 structure-specific endonuclease subunit [Sugiyamaella lignohabitans]